MWMRRAFFRWLIPAAFVLPLWLFVGWIVFGANPWALLWVIVSAPLVLIGQLLLTLLVRARGTVRHDRAVSWTDFAVLGAWHVLIVALGVFDGRWWWGAFALTIVVGVAAAWTSLVQLWREARSLSVYSDPTRLGSGPGARRTTRAAEPEVFVITEDDRRL